MSCCISSPFVSITRHTYTRICTRAYVHTLTHAHVHTRIHTQTPGLYFSDPSQLLQMFMEVEDQDLTLIQNGQEIEESLQDVVEKAKRDQEVMAKVVSYFLISSFLIV